MHCEKGRSIFVLGRCLVLLLVLLLVGSVLSFRVENVEGRGRLFSFVQIGDTQWGNKTQLQSIVDFIVDNKTVFGIEYVVHMGDIVEVYDNKTDWELKDSAFSQLTNNVSFGWLTGNHDGELQDYIGNDYFAFNVSNYPSMTSSFDRGRNTAQYFNFGGKEFLFVNLDYFANDSALLWFEDLYHHYNEAVVVFSTHSYLDFLGNYTQETINATYLEAYPRVNLVLCGHIPYSLNHQVDGRQEIRFNYQRVPDYFPDLSDFIRIYSVYDDGSVDSITYSPMRNLYLSDSLNQFSFNLFTIPTPTPTPTVSPTQIPTPVPTPSPSFTPKPEFSPSQDFGLEFYVIVVAVFLLVTGLLVFMLKKNLIREKN